MMQLQFDIFLKVTILSGATILSGVTVSASPQGSPPCAAHKKPEQKAQTQHIQPVYIHSPTPLTNSALVAQTLPPIPSLVSAPPIENNEIGVEAGSISPLNQQLIPQSADLVGEVEPVLQTAPMTDTLPIVLVAQAEKLSPQTQSVTPQAIMSPNGWAKILGKYTAMDGQGLVRFDYNALQSMPSDMKLLADYIADLSTKSPSVMTDNEAMAYWANLYNALTVQVVAQNYPVTSIRKIKSGRRKGPWKRKLVRVEGQDLSLDNIEHDILRPTYKTPLVHYMVNCASIGCPNLKTSPWQAANLQADMEAAARAYIDSMRGVKFENNKLEVSRIYKWFKKDFGNSEAGVLEHLKQYGSSDIRQKLATRTKIDKYGYDWALNAP